MTHTADTATDALHITLLAPPWYAVPPEGYGGIEIVVADLAEGLIARGHQVTVVATGPRGTRADTFSTYPEPQSARIGNAVVEVAHAAAAARLIEQVQPDVVHDHCLAGPLLARARRQPTVVTVHGPVTDDFALYYRSLGHEVGLVALSEAQCRPAPDLAWVGTVHNALRVERFPFQDAKDDYTLVLARCSPDKGVHLAIDAARAAGRRLVMALKCSEPQERDYFEEYVEPRLGPDVDYVGEASFTDKLKLLAGASCLLFPVCWDEPFGMVAIEAMACGTPVVGFGRGALPETIRDRVTGVLVSRPDELPAAIGRASSLSPAACREHVERTFSSAGMAEGYERVYRRMLATPTVAPN